MGFFKKGDQRKLAQAMGVSDQYLSDVFGRRRRVSAKKAITFERISAELGHYIPAEAYAFSLETNHPAFKPRES